MILQKSRERCFHGEDGVVLPDNLEETVSDLLSRRHVYVVPELRLNVFDDNNVFLEQEYIISRKLGYIEYFIREIELYTHNFNKRKVLIERIKSSEKILPEDERYCTIRDAEMKSPFPCEYYIYCFYSCWITDPETNIAEKRLSFRGRHIRQGF